MTRAVHPRRGPAEFTLVVYCDYDHPEQDVDVLGYWPDPDGEVFGFLNWLSANGSLQTPFGELMAAEDRSGRTVDLGGWSRTPRGMDHETRWRFECPECGRTLPGSGKKMAVILDVLRRHGVSRISLPQIASRL